ncbi:uncharacterized protein [Ciconia boyciana]|uniref:uncharacterized protein isoform X3 n=1 Tax=Ciconia boyciana TaxID=52775 RepID=UPI003B9FC608
MPSTPLPRNPLGEPQRSVTAPPCLAPPMTGGDPGLWEPCGSQAVGWRGRRVGGSWRPYGGQSHRCPHAPSLVGALAGRPPLPALAEVSEQLFRDGINWGRIVVFFYFTYRVVRQALWGDHPLRTILDWAISFLQQRLSAWIQQQGGWGSILSYSPRQLSQDPHAMGSPEK